MKNTLSGNEGRGFMKILVAADTDTVVGVHLIGPETAEIIQVSLPAQPQHSCSCALPHAVWHSAWHQSYQEPGSNMSACISDSDHQPLIMFCC